MVKYVIYVNGHINLKSITMLYYQRCPLVFVSFNFDRIRKKFMMSEDMNRLKYDRRL